MEENKKYNWWDTQIAISLIICFIMCPILVQAFLFESVGLKSLIFLVVIIPYYLGLYKFKKSIFGLS